MSLRHHDFSKFISDEHMDKEMRVYGFMECK